MRDLAHEAFLGLPVDMNELPIIRDNSYLL